MLRSFTHLSCSAVADIVGAIGKPSFGATTAMSVLGLFEFQLATLIVHRSQRPSEVLFDNFDQAAGQLGIHNYVSVTHRINPILRKVKGTAAIRARDFATNVRRMDHLMSQYVVAAEDEELGFRTVGWPARLEEIGLYFEGPDGLVELSLFRERSRRVASASKLAQLAALSLPISAFFRKHIELARRSPPRAVLFAAALTQRELQVTELLLDGCGSEAIARRLDISCYTVKDHRKQIYRKLGIGSLGELFALNQRSPRAARAPGENGYPPAVAG
jgi:DNA-binding CsgD family transcriptional regulator